MSIARKCDMCGKLYEEYNQKHDEKNPNGIMLLNIVENGNYYGNSKIDCCPECMTSILKTIENLKEKKTKRLYL